MLTQAKKFPAARALLLGAALTGFCVGTTKMVLAHGADPVAERSTQAPTGGGTASVTTTSMTAKVKGSATKGTAKGTTQTVPFGEIRGESAEDRHRDY